MLGKMATKNKRKIILMAENKLCLCNNFRIRNKLWMKRVFIKTERQTQENEISPRRILKWSLRTHEELF